MNKYYNSLILDVQCLAGCKFRGLTPEASEDFGSGPTGWTDLCHRTDELCFSLCSAHMNSSYRKPELLLRLTLIRACSHWVTSAHVLLFMSVRWLCLSSERWKTDCVVAAQLLMSCGITLERHVGQNLDTVPRPQSDRPSIFIYFNTRTTWGEETKKERGSIMYHPTRICFYWKNIERQEVTSEINNT